MSWSFSLSPVDFNGGMWIRQLVDERDDATDEGVTGALLAGDPAFDGVTKAGDASDAGLEGAGDLEAAPLLAADAAAAPLAAPLAAIPQRWCGSTARKWELGKLE